MLDRPTHSTGGPHGGHSFARSHSGQVRISVNVRGLSCAMSFGAWPRAVSLIHSYSQSRVTGHRPDTALHSEDALLRGLWPLVGLEVWNIGL